MKTICARTVAGLLAAVMGAGVPAAQAGSYGNAPWCAVQNLGAGDVTWDCEFRSAEDCIPHVIAGNRGFCNMNPSFVPPAAAMPVETSQAAFLKRCGRCRYIRVITVGAIPASIDSASRR